MVSNARPISQICLRYHLDAEAELGGRKKGLCCLRFVDQNTSTFHASPSFQATYNTHRYFSVRLVSSCIIPKHHDLRTVPEAHVTIAQTLIHDSTRSASYVDMFRSLNAQSYLRLSSRSPNNDRRTAQLCREYPVLDLHLGALH